MGIADLWRGMVHPVATRLTYFRMEDHHVLDDAVSPTPAVAEEVYLQVSAASVHLKHDASFFSRYVPGIAAVVTETLASGTREYIRVAGTSDLEKLKASGTGKTITINKAVSPLIPFAGGSIEVILGLVAFETSNSLPGLLDVVADVSKLVGGPAAAATADTIGDVVAKGFQTLLGSGVKDLKLALEHRWDGADGGVGGSDALVLREGYWVLLNEPDRRRDDLWIKDGQLMTGGSSSDLRALDGVDYMVLRLDTRTTRDDWQDFCRDELDRRDTAMVMGDQDEVVAQSRAAKAKIANSRLFTRKDKLRRIAELTAAETAVPPTVTIEHRAALDGIPAGDLTMADALGADDIAVDVAVDATGLHDAPRERLADYLD